MPAALVSGSLGVLLLYVAWRGAGAARRWLVAAGWLLVAASCWSWAGHAGVEFGLAFAMLQVPLVAWLLVGSNTHVRSNKARPQTPVALAAPGVAGVLRHVGIFLVAVPLAGCSSALLVLALGTMLPLDEPGRIAVVILVLPIAWGLAAYWATAGASLLRPAAGLAAGAAICAALLL